MSATENISDSPEGIILESVLEGMAEFYSAELSQKVSRGMNETALKCNSTGGVLPLGYKVDKPSKKYVIDPLTAPIVQEAFARYVAGENITDIIADFNRRGYRTSRGQEFNKNSFKTMFQNKKYIGIYTYNNIEIEGGMPVIVDKETFDLAQRRLATNKQPIHSGKSKVDYILTGKLYCGHCGGMMIGDSGHSQTADKTYNYYACQNQRRHKCDKHPVPKVLIEREVVRQTYNLLTPEFIDELAEMCIKANREDIENDTRIPAINNEIKAVERKINNLFKLVENGAESESLAERLTELEQQKSALREQLEDAKGDYIILEKPHIVWWLTRFADGDVTDEKYCKDLINLLVNTVTVWDDPDVYRITVTLNTTESITEVNSDELLDGSPLERYPNCFPILGGKSFRYSAKIGRG